MKRQTQQTGVRKYFGDDLVELQAEPLHAIDAMLAAAGQCVISGCQIEQTGDKFIIAPGYVALSAVDEQSGSSRIMVMPFDGAIGVTLPVYLTANVDVVERAYGDGAVKPIAYSYKATASAIKPTNRTSIEISATYTRRLSDALAEALTAYVVVTATEKAVWNAKETPAGAQAKADAAKTAAIADAKKYTDDSKYIHPSDANTRHATDAEKAAWNAKASTAVVTTSTNGLMAAADKTKLNGIATGANNYVHPSDANTRHATDAEKAAWNAKASTAVATTGANGLMAAADKTKLNGIATGANNYVHPATHAISQVSDLQTALDGKVIATDNNGMRCSGSTTTLPYVSINTEIKPDGVYFGTTFKNTGSVRRDGITMPPNAVMDMPGVLRAGAVSALGENIDSWGSTKADVRRTSQGKYRITHYIGHTNYFFSGTLTGGFTGAVTIISRQSSYIDVEIRGLDANLHDVAFDYIICGKN